VTGLPPGWRVASLTDLADTALGKMLDKGKPRGLPRVPYLRNVNVQWGRIDTDDLLTMELADDERERFAVEAGDLLVCEGGDIGRAAIWPGRIGYLAYQKALHRIRVNDDLDARYLRYFLEHAAKAGELAKLSTGSTIAHLPQQALRRLPVPHPRVVEQRRIVEILEDHLFRLDAADAGLSTASRRLERLRMRLIQTAILGEAVPGPRSQSELPAAGTYDAHVAPLPAGWSWQRLGDIADVVGGVTKDAKKQSDPSYVETPYLRVANVQRGQLLLDNVANLKVPPGKREQLELQQGDVLLNEGGDRDKLARGWVWEEQIPGCIHQNHVFRARLREARLSPYFVAFATNTLGGPWAERNGKQSVNLASISLTTIKKMPLPIPEGEDSHVIAAELRERLRELSRLDAALASARTRSVATRRGVLAAAFSGRLTGHRVDEEIIEETAESLE